MPIVPIIGILIVCVGFALLYRQRSIHNERMLLEYRFYETQDRCANADMAIRFAALSQLTDMAKQRFPGRGRTVNSQNHPFFVRTVDTFSNLISRENKAEVVAVLALELLFLMWFWKKSRDITANELVQTKLHVAHHSARNSFIEALAAYWTFQPEQEKHLIAEQTQELVNWRIYGSASKLYKEEERRKVVTELCLSEYFALEMKRWEKIKQQMSDDAAQRKSDAILLSELQSAVNRYTATVESWIYSTRHFEYKPMYDE